MSSEVDISVVIPCKDGGRTLGRQLDALHSQQTTARVEVLVCDNRSTDDSRAVVEAHPSGARVVDASHSAGINVARNAGVVASRGELILFCDADDVVHPHWAQAYWERYQGGDLIMGGALRRVWPDGSSAWQRQLNDDLGFLPWPTGSNCAVAREVIEHVGSFDDQLRGGGDETEFFWRAQLAGNHLAFVDDAAIDYYQRDTARSAFQQRIGYGRSHVRLFVRFKDHGMPRQAGARSAEVLLRTVLTGLRTRDLTSAARSCQAQLGVIVGRARESMRARSLYV